MKVITFYSHKTAGSYSHCPARGIACKVQKADQRSIIQESPLPWIKHSLITHCQSLSLLSVIRQRLIASFLQFLLVFFVHSLPIEMFHLCSRKIEEKAVCLNYNCHSPMKVDTCCGNDFLLSCKTHFSRCSSPNKCRRHLWPHSTLPSGSHSAQTLPDSQIVPPFARARSHTGTERGHSV